jgi:hypothetical protein
VGGGNQIDIVGTLVDEVLEDFSQVLFCHFLAQPLAADFIVLAEHALEGAAGEKHGPGAFFARHRRLLPVVQSRPGQIHRLRHTAEALPFCLSPKGAAFPGT